MYSPEAEDTVGKVYAEWFRKGLGCILFTRVLPFNNSMGESTSPLTHI
jgi:hypothetical protein